MRPSSRAAEQPIFSGVVAQGPMPLVKLDFTDWMDDQKHR